MWRVGGQISASLSIEEQGNDVWALPGPTGPGGSATNVSVAFSPAVGWFVRDGLAIVGALGLYGTYGDTPSPSTTFTFSFGASYFFNGTGRFQPFASLTIGPGFVIPRSVHYVIPAGGLPSSRTAAFFSASLGLGVQIVLNDYVGLLLSVSPTVRPWVAKRSGTTFVMPFGVGVAAYL